jgi:hypothetical protein
MYNIGFSERAHIRWPMDRDRLRMYTIGSRLPAVGTLKRYSKALEYEYRVKTAALGTLK